jgi:hypothetical protein
MNSTLGEQTMEKQMLEDIKELFQAFIAPQLEGIKGDIRALDMKIDTKMDSLDIKIESYRRELIAEMRGMDQGIQRVEKTLSTELIRLEQKVDLRLASMDEKIDLFRRQILG